MKLTEIFPKDGYRLFLRYDDGACGEVDLSSYAGRKAVIDIDILAFIDGHPRSANFKPRSSIRDLRPPTEVIFFAGHVGDNAASGKKGHGGYKPPPRSASLDKRRHLVAPPCLRSDRGRGTLPCRLIGAALPIHS